MEFLESRLFISIISLLGVWFVGNAIATRWQIVKREKEIVLETAQKFYDTYGEFYAVWKIWNHHVRGQKAAGDIISKKIGLELFKRASEMEGDIEATLLKMAAEFHLTDINCQELGELRQAFGLVRYCINHKVEIPFTHDGHALYKELKFLSSSFGTQLTRPMDLNITEIFCPKAKPTKEEAFNAWAKITDNVHEKSWKDKIEV